MGFNESVKIVSTKHVSKSDDLGKAKQESVALRLAS